MNRASQKLEENLPAFAQISESDDIGIMMQEKKPNEINNTPEN